jgi:hypothetical protein
MTGRGAGYCSGNSGPGFQNSNRPGIGRGFGRGWGRGPGFGRGRGSRYFWRGRYPPQVDMPDDYPDYYQPIPPSAISKEEEKNYLEKMVESLENELKDIKTRLKELSSKTEK